MESYLNYQFDNDEVKWDEELDGVLPKGWIETTSFGRALFKQSSISECKIEDPRTDWSEKVAYELAKLLILPAAQYELATVNSEERQLSGSISIDCSATSAEKRYSLVDVLTDELDKYDFPGDYSVANTIAALDSANVTIPPHYQLPPGINNAGNMFVGVMMFDCLIGNGDRHDRNLEVVVAPDGKSYLSPVFDQGASLGANFTLEARKAMSPEDFNSIHNPAFFQDGDREITLIEAFTQAAALRPEAAKIWLQKLKELAPTQIDEIFIRIPEKRISPEATTFAKQLLTYNKEQLLSLEKNLEVANPRIKTLQQQYTEVVAPIVKNTLEQRQTSSIIGENYNAIWNETHQLLTLNDARTGLPKMIAFKENNLWISRPLPSGCPGLSEQDVNNFQKLSQQINQSNSKSKKLDLER